MSIAGSEKEAAAAVQPAPATARPDLELAGALELAALDHRGLGGRPAHVDADRVRPPDPAGELGGRDHTGRRARLDHVDRAPPAARRGHDAAVRLHDEDRGPDAEPPELRLEAPEVAAHHRHDVGVGDRRARALELPHLGEDLRGQRQVHGRRPLPDDRRRGLLVGVARVRVEKRDRDRLDALAGQSRRPPDAGRVQRRQDLAAGSETLDDLAPPAARDQRRRPLEVDVV
jgi:hypothetical protein